MFEKVNNRYALRKTKKGLASLMIGMLVVSMGTTVVGATGLVEDGNNEETHSQVETEAVGDIVYVDEPISYGSDFYQNPELEFEEHKLVQDGQPGTKSVEYIKTEEGYVPTGVETVLVEPQNAKVEVGNYDTQVEIYDRGVEYVEDPTIPLGETHIINEGRDGERHIFMTYEVDTTTGELFNPTEKFEYTPPMNRIVGVGTGEDVVIPELDTYTLEIIRGDDVETVEYDAENVEDAEEYFENLVTSLGGEYTKAYDPDTLTFSATLEEPDRYILKRVIRGATDTIGYYGKDVADAELHFKNHMDELGLGDYGYFEWTYDAETLTFTATLVEEEEPVELDTYTLVITSSEVTSEITFEAETAEDAEVYFKNHINELGLGAFGYFEWTYDAETLTFTATFVETDTYTLNIIRGDEVETVEFDADTYGEAEEYFKNLVTSLEGEYSKTVNIFTRTFTARLVEPENPSELDTYTLSLTTSEGTSETTYEAENAEDAELHFRNHVDELGLGDFTWAYDAETLTFSATLNEEEEPEDPDVPVELTTYTLEIIRGEEVETVVYDAETYEEAAEYFDNLLIDLGGEYRKSFSDFRLTFTARFVEPENPTELVTYTLSLTTSEGTSETTIEAENAEDAEFYFINHVDELGLGEFTWAYDAETLTFTAILEDPDTENPDTENPDTETPDTDNPDTEDPDTENPDTEEPDTEDPDTEDPDTEDPDTEDPDTETPDTEDPDTEDPDTEEPDTEDPDTDNPDTEDPDTEDPDTDNPDTEDPDTDNPDTEDPDTEDPDTEDPDTEDPDTDNPDTEDPDTDNPDTEDPDTEDPDTEDPDTEDPDTEDPDTEDPDTEDPDTENPDTEDPDTPKTPEEQQPVGTGESNDSNQEELPPLGEASSLVGISSVLLASGLSMMLPKKRRKED